MLQIFQVMSAERRSCGCVTFLRERSRWARLSLTFVELNCENLFDYHDDVDKDDAEYLPEATRHWTRKRY